VTERIDLATGGSQHVAFIGLPSIAFLCSASSRFQSVS
jgi:hypothetical protein